MQLVQVPPCRLFGLPPSPSTTADPPAPLLYLTPPLSILLPSPQLLLPHRGVPPRQRAPPHPHADVAQPAVPAVRHRAGAHRGRQPAQPQRRAVQGLPGEGAPPRRLTEQWAARGVRRTAEAGPQHCDFQ